MSAASDAHIDGDCWPSQCQICAYEDAQHEAECQSCADSSRCETCDERMCIDGPEPRICATTCHDCPCDCSGCLDVRLDMAMELACQIEREGRS